MGGSFTAVGGVKQRGIALLSADGTRDGNFIASITGAGKVSAFALGPDGSILVGGDFTNLNGRAKSGLARLESDGTLDSGFEAAVERPVSSGPLVSALSVLADGSILVGGAFTKANGIPRNFLAQFNEDGSLKSEFAPRLDEPVVSLFADESRGIIVLQASTGFPTATNSIRRVKRDGSVDTEFAPISQIIFHPRYSTISGIALQFDGKLLVFGNNFGVGTNDLFGGQIARFNADACLDSAFSPDPRIRYLTNLTVAVQKDGKIVVGGSPQYINGTTTNTLIRLNSDGSFDPSFNPGGLVTGTVTHLAVEPEGGGILFSGNLKSVNELTVGTVARVMPIPNAFLQPTRLAGGGVGLLLMGQTGQTYFRSSPLLWSRRNGINFRE